MQQQQPFQLANREQQRIIESIFREIDKNILDDDDDIIKELSRPLNELTNEDRNIILEYLWQGYRSHSFYKKGDYQKGEGVKQDQQEIDHKLIYKELKETKQFSKIIQLMKNDDFCSENGIPKVVQENVVLLQKLGDKLNDFFHLIEIQQGNCQISQFALLKKLLQFAYFNQLQDNQQLILEQMIGSLLLNQIYQFQFYLDKKKGEDQKKFEEFVQETQRIQTKEQDWKFSSDKEFSFLQKLFTQDLNRGKENLDQYLKQVLLQNDQQMCYQVILEQLGLRKNQVEIQEIFFMVIWFFWISYATSYKLQDEIYLLEQKLSEVEEERKLILFDRFLQKQAKNNSNILTFFVNRGILFTNSLGFLEKNENYQRYKTQQFESENAYTQQKCQSLKELLSLPKAQFMNFWFVLQQVQYHYLRQQLTTDNIYNTLLIFLWMNKIDMITQERFETIFNQKQDNILSCAKKIEETFVESKQFLNDILTFAQRFYQWDSQELNLMHLLRQEYGSFKEIDDLMINQMLEVQASTKSHQAQLKLTELCYSIFSKDAQLYEKWLGPLQYLNEFKITPNFFKLQQISQQYPSNMNIKLEDFNISLVEQNDLESQALVSAWVNNMRDRDCFYQLIPFYFNIIKRGESSDQLITKLSQAQKGRNQIESFNMKVLFQILYNNANEELKVMLLKLQSKWKPIPLLYQNPNFEKIANVEELYQFNHYIFYVFKDSFTIINFSLSEIINQTGKTNLINQIFYKKQVFQENDECKISKNSIDLMFDYIFNDSRQFAIADVHGQVPISIFQKILPLFKLWIIQMDTEQEIEQNFKQIKKFQQIISQRQPKICFIIRNSREDMQQQFQDVINQVKAEAIEIHYILDLSEKGIKDQVKKDELDHASKVLYSQIKLYYQEENFLTQKEFLQIAKSFNNENDRKILDEIETNSQIIDELEEELTLLSKTKDGFYNQQAFPIRSIEQKIKEKTEQYRTKPENEKKELNSDIEDLRKLINMQSQTTILKIFYSIFDQENFYILFVWFTDRVRQFNDRINSEINNTCNKDEQKSIQVIGDTKLCPTSLKSISIEIFWRELIQQYQKCRQPNINFDPIQIIYDLIQKGEAFELLDGDILKINSSFLERLAEKFEQKDEGRILVLSVLGPQSSGKSTLLNKIFGCHFLTSLGRCTKGIYLQILKIHNKEQFDNKFNYILLLDTEGLQNPNQQDPEFDKKITLLVLEISDIILINVKGDISLEFKKLIEMSVFSLKDKFSQKQPSWCFNQNNDASQKYKFKDQISSMAKNLNEEFRKIKSADKEEDKLKLDYNQLLDIENENVSILGVDSLSERWEQNDKSGIFEVWRERIHREQYCQDAYRYGIQIIKRFQSKFNTQTGQININCFFRSFSEDWETIQRLPDLVEFSELIQHKQNEFMKKQFEEIYSRQDFSFKDKIKTDFTDEVNKLIENQTWGIQGFDKIQKSITQTIESNLESIKNKVKENIEQIKDTSQSNQDKIQKKIITQYIKQLENRINSEQSECEMIVLEIKQLHLRKYFEDEGFEQIDFFLAQLSIEELFHYKKNSELATEKFNEMWQGIENKQNEYSDKIFDDFQLNAYQTLQASSEYRLVSKKESEYLQFFQQFINKRRLDTISNEKKDIQNEKEQIYNMFQDELTEAPFVMISNNQYHKRYMDIFIQKIEDKLQKASEKDLIDIRKFFYYNASWKYIEKSNISTYLKTLFFSDLKQFLQLCKERKSYNQIFSFFSILQKLQIKYDDKALSTCIEKIKNKSSLEYDQNEYQKYLEDIQVSFAELLISLNFDPQKQIKNIKSFPFHQYPSLKLVQVDKLFQSQELVNQQRELIKTQNIIIEENVEITPYNNDIHFKYIMDQSQYQYEFQLHFPLIFNQQVQKYSGWKKLYFSIYDYIQERMTLDTDSSYRSNLVKEIMGQIEQDIIKYNKEFANFGIYLRDLGVRYIYYFSIFIIWRFTCQKRWINLETNRIKFSKESDLYKSQLIKFQAEINQDKVEQSILKARAMNESIFEGFVKNFYEIQHSSAEDSIENQQITSIKLIERLDNIFLKEIDRTNQIAKEKAMDYIKHQKLVIQNYVQEVSDSIKIQIAKTYEETYEQEHQQFLQPLLYNSDKLFTQIEQLKIKTKQYFVDQSKDEDYYESQLYEIVLCCLQGKKALQLELIHSQYHELFSERLFKKIELKQFGVTNKSDQKIPSLCHFIAELSKSLRERKEKKNEFQLKELKIEGKLDELRVKMRGCLEECPLCKRKCDQMFKHNGAHMCERGHYLRGMNGILIENTPSPFTCEEIENDALINTSETKEKKTWKQVISQYPEWDFRKSQGTEQLEQLKNRMKNIWNGGVGQIMCQWLQKELKNDQVIFELKAESRSLTQKQKPVHQIFMLDDSGSMEGQRWENAKLGALECMKGLQKNSEALVTVIIFNSDARVVIDCQKIDIDQQHKLIVFDSGGTDFGAAFDLAYEQILKHQDRNIPVGIFFYTDGESSYPDDAIEKFCTLPKNVREQLTVILCTEADESDVLAKMAETLEKHTQRAEFKNSIQTSALEQAFQETVSRDYHKLK